MSLRSSRTATQLLRLHDAKLRLDAETVRYGGLSGVPLDRRSDLGILICRDPSGTEVLGRRTRFGINAQVGKAHDAAGGVVPPVQRSTIRRPKST
jgi:hypothetical protein